MNRTLQLIGLTVEQVRNHPGLNRPRSESRNDYTGQFTGERRKAVRDMMASGFSAKEIALHLGIAQSTVSKYANGR